MVIVDTMEEAFDLCREANRPLRILVMADGQIWKVYPSGRAERKYLRVHAPFTKPEKESDHGRRL